MTQEKNTIQPLDFIIIYIGGAFIAGWLQQLLRQLFPVLAEATAGRLVSGLWLQNGLMLLFLVLALHLRSASWQDIGARPLKDWKTVLGAILAGYLIYLLMTLAMNFLNSFLPNGLDAQNVSAYMQADDALWVKAFVLITMGVFGPIVEELLFRGYLYNSLCRNLSSPAAMLFTAIIFGAAHLDWQRFLPLAIGGYLLNVISVRFGSVFASVITHGVWNILMMVVYYLAL